MTNVSYLFNPQEMFSMKYSKTKCPLIIATHTMSEFQLQFPLEKTSQGQFGKSLHFEEFSLPFPNKSRVVEENHREVRGKPEGKPERNGLLKVRQ